MKTNTEIEVGRVLVWPSITKREKGMSGEADLQFEWTPTNCRTSPEILLEKLSQYLCEIPGIITSKNENSEGRTINSDTVKKFASEWLDDYLGKSNWKWHTMWTAYAVL